METWNKMAAVFHHDISDWLSWRQVFRSIPAFVFLARRIFQKENLPWQPLEKFFPGTNAVFKASHYVIKIFAPAESGLDTASDFSTEIFGLERAAKLGIPTPELIAKGSIEDKYLFRYIITTFVTGSPFSDELDAALSNHQKHEIGYRLRLITDKLNTPCLPFNEIDYLNRSYTDKSWNGYPRRFQEERMEFLKQYKPDSSVFVHGDINPGNVILAPDGDLCILDYADALLAPPEYELPPILGWLFNFNNSYMTGYIRLKNMLDITDLCITGLLYHNFGSDIIGDNLGNTHEITDLAVLKSRLHARISHGVGH